MKRIYLKEMLGVVSLASAFIVAHAQPAAAQSFAAGSASRKAEEVYKNIQVLKGMPADQMDSTMLFFSASLGLVCRECYVGGAAARVYESDDNPRKLIARNMVPMMNSINERSFNGARQVTCYTCHRGSTKAVGVPELLLAAC